MIHKVNVKYTLTGSVDVDANSPEEAQCIFDTGSTDLSGKKFDKLYVMLKTVLEMISERERAVPSKLS